MVRISHQKSAKQSTSSNTIRSSKVAKQRKNHKVVIESDTNDQEKARAVLSFRADPPPGYTFIPAGNPQLTSALKEFAKRSNHKIFAVTTTPHATRHELSREVHRIGFHFPTEVVAQVCNHYGIRLTSGGKLVEEKDDDKLFMRLYQKGQLVLDEKVRDQVTINTEAKQIIKDLFPNIPDNDLFQIIKTAFQLGDGKVGTADEIPLVRRAQLSVVAHIRHSYTNYDKLLRSVPYSEARHRVESITLQKLIEWRGDDQDDKQAMDDTLREVVVISDEEDSDGEVEEGQLLENEYLRVQAVNGAVRSDHVAGERPRSPVEIHSDDEAPKGYRYLPRVVRRYPVADPQANSIARQQSRYAVWDRVRQEYRSGAAPQPPRVVERILIDESSIVPSPVTYVTREPAYVSEPAVRRIVEPAARIVSQPSGPNYIRGTDGKLYEKITTRPEPDPAPVPLRRLYTPPPTDYSRQYTDSRQASPRPQHPGLHRRTESFENNDGTIIPSIESANAPYSSSATRRNPFAEPRPLLNHRNSGAYESNQHPPPIIDLTRTAEQANKRRRAEQSPLSPYHLRHPDRNYENHERNVTRSDMPYQHSEDPSLRQQQLIPLENPTDSHDVQRPYIRPESRMQPTIIYREETNYQGVSSLQNSYTTHMLPSSAREPLYVQSPRRSEYVVDHSRVNTRPYGEVVRPYTAGVASNDVDGHNRVILERTPSLGQPSTYYTEPGVRYIRSEARNSVEAPMQSRYFVQASPVELSQGEYGPSVAPQYPPTHRDIRITQLQPNDGAYQPSRMAPPPTTYRDGQGLRTTYVQN